MSYSSVLILFASGGGSVNSISVFYLKTLIYKSHYPNYLKTHVHVFTCRSDVQNFITLAQVVSNNIKICMLKQGKRQVLGNKSCLADEQCKCTHKWG